MILKRLGLRTILAAAIKEFVPPESYSIRSAMRYVPQGIREQYGIRRSTKVQLSDWKWAVARVQSNIETKSETMQTYLPTTQNEESSSKPLSWDSRKDHIRKRLIKLNERKILPDFAFVLHNEILDSSTSMEQYNNGLRAKDLR